MGPAICELIEAQGAEVIAHVGSLVDPKEPGKIVAEAGKVNVLIANMAESVHRQRLLWTSLTMNGMMSLKQLFTLCRS